MTDIGLGRRFSLDVCETTGCVHACEAYLLSLYSGLDRMKDVHGCVVVFIILFKVLIVAVPIGAGSYNFNIRGK